MEKIDLEQLKYPIGKFEKPEQITHDQIQERINSSLVLNQLELIRLRGHHPAFNGQLEIIDTDVDLIELHWTLAEDWAQLSVDLRQKSFSVTHS